jgi:hypothetical protein
MMWFVVGLNAHAIGPQIELTSNKTTYIDREPIILRAVLRNGPNQYQFDFPGLHWGSPWGFTIDVGRGQSKLASILDGDIADEEENSDTPFGVPLNRDYFTDRSYLPHSLSPNQVVSRFDMISLAPGEYKLRATINDSNGSVYQSNIISVRVDPVSPTDTILDPQAPDVDDLALTIVNVYYLHGMRGACEDSWSVDEFLQHANEVFETHPNSTYYPYTVFAYASYLMSYDGDPEFIEAQVNDAENRAVWFIQTFPNSWLVPELAAILFDYYQREKRVPAAIAIGQQLVASHPDNLLVKNSGIREKLIELQNSNTDTIKPSITIIGNNEISHECGTPYTDASATATDDKDGDLTASITVQNNVNPTVPGAYTVVYTVSDAAGNTATATRTVNVVDTSAPVLACQDNQVVTAVACGGAVSFNVPTALDQCDGTLEVACTPTSSNVLAPGVQTVNCSATDASGNTGTCSFTVDVKDRLQARFVAPLSDDNADNNIETDADVVNTFKVGSRVINKVKLFDCAGNDVTEAYASLVSVKLDVTLRTTTNTGSDVVNDVPEVSSGVGNAGGLMIPVGDHFQYNLDTTGYAAGTVNDERFYRSAVTVEWVSAPGLVVGGEDALLESKP